MSNVENRMLEWPMPETLDTTIRNPAKRSERKFAYFKPIALIELSFLFAHKIKSKQFTIVNVTIELTKQT